MLLEKFYYSFPELKASIDDSIKECKKIGYVEDILGRRRRLPNIQLPFYKIQYIDNPYINQNNPDYLISSYKDKLEALGEVSKSNNDLSSFAGVTVAMKCDSVIEERCSKDDKYYLFVGRQCLDVGDYFNYDM